MESESLPKLIELLSVQQINIHEINDNTEKFITAKETSKTNKTKLNHQQDYRIPLSDSFETLAITNRDQDKPKPTDEDYSMISLFDRAASKRTQKTLLTKRHKQPKAHITNYQYEESLEQRKALVVPGRKTCSVATKFGKKNCVIVDSHLSRIKRSIFQKSALVNLALILV